MKKAKVIFTALALVAVVSGALAFKAKTFLPPNVFTLTTTQVGGPLTCIPTAFRTTVPPNGVQAQVYTRNDCPVLVSTRIIPSDTQ